MKYIIDRIGHKFESSSLYLMKNIENYLVYISSLTHLQSPLFQKDNNSKVNISLQLNDTNFAMCHHHSKERSH